MSRNLFDTETSGAVFSPDGLHRVRLWRIWNPELPVLVWCLLNPSVAGAERSDLTLAKCIGFAKRNGYGGVIIVNLFTLVATDPDELLRQLQVANVRDADEHIRWACHAAPRSTVVLGWGSKLWAEERARHVVRLLTVNAQLKLHCLGTTKDGNPRHPSRLGYDTPLVEL